MPKDSQQDAAILVMDRSDKDAKLMASMLEKVGLEVQISSNQDIVLESCRSKSRPVRLVILDEQAEARMPGLLDGLNTCDSSIRVLLVGQSDEAAGRNWVSATKGRGVLQKPFRRAQFLGSVLKLINEPLVRTA
ncbi:MAG TPA: response regulator [Bryobacteraceae bacterium]|nr:response regulator [Bryobacteraceae bacterium]